MRKAVGDALADAGHDVAAQGREDAHREVDADQQAHQPDQRPRLVLRGHRQESQQIEGQLDVPGGGGLGVQDIVDEDAQQQRLAQAEVGGHHHEQQAEGDEPPVRPGVAQQPEEELALLHAGRAHAVASRNDLAATVAALAPGPGAGQPPVEHLAAGILRAGLADQAFDLLGQLGQGRHQALGEHGHGRAPLAGADLEGRRPQVLPHFHPPDLGQGQADQVGRSAAVGAEGHQQVVGGHQPGLAVAAVEADIRGYGEAELFAGGDDVGQLAPDPRGHGGAESPLGPAALSSLHALAPWSSQDAHSRRMARLGPDDRRRHRGRAGRCFRAAWRRPGWRSQQVPPLLPLLKGCYPHSRENASAHPAPGRCRLHRLTSFSSAKRVRIHSRPTPGQSRSRSLRRNSSG